MYCSGLPVVAAKAELNSFRKAGKSFIFPFGTFVSILRFGIFDLVDSLCKNDITQEANEDQAVRQLVLTALF